MSSCHRDVPTDDPPTDRDAPELTQEERAAAAARAVEQVATALARQR